MVDVTDSCVLLLDYYYFFCGWWHHGFSTKVLSSYSSMQLWRSWDLFQSRSKYGERRLVNTRGKPGFVLNTYVYA